MAEIQLSKFVSRVFTATLVQLSNGALGMDAAVDVGGAKWKRAKAELDALGVQDEDVLITTDSPIDGTGSLTYGEVKAVIAALATGGAAFKAVIDQLSILSTDIDLPR